MDLWLGLSYCDGKWNEVTVNKEGSVISATMNELREQALEPRVQQLQVNSPVYVGGIPPEIQSFYRELGLEQGKMTKNMFSKTGVMHQVDVLQLIVWIHECETRVFPPTPWDSTSYP